MFDSTSPAMPEPYATIAAMRRNRQSEREIALELGLTSDQLRRRHGWWNRDNPDNPLPDPVNRPQVSMSARVAALVQQGLSVTAAAEALGVSLMTAKNAYYRACDRGLLRPSRTRPMHGMRRYKSLQRAGGAPHMGAMRDVIDALDAPTLRALLNQTRPADAHLASTIARLLTEHLHGKK